MATTVLGCAGKPRTMTYKIISQWPCTVCKTQRNDFDQKSPEVAKAYSNVLETYPDKGYIRKVLPGEEKPDQVWYLPHFPILRPDKSTTWSELYLMHLQNVRKFLLMTFCCKVSSSKMTCLLYSFDFRRDPVALMCEELYLQIKLNPSDRPYQPFVVA